MAAAGSEAALATRVEHVEYLGHEILAHLTLGPHRLVARLPETALTPGAPLLLEVPGGELHLFGKDGAALGTESTSPLAAPGGR